MLPRRYVLTTDQSHAGSAGRVSRLTNRYAPAQVQAVVVGLSVRLDTAELLEKRVLSRFSHRKLVFGG
eukprot:3533978-Pyramimonas_sp.AAC.1